MAVTVLKEEIGNQVDRGPARTPPSSDGADRQASLVACAGLVANHLRRTQSRIIDVEWMLRSRSYARHVLSLAAFCDEAALRHCIAVLSEGLIQDARRDPPQDDPGTRLPEKVVRTR